MYKLLALDMDGTLLNPDKIMTAGTIHSIQKLILAGTAVTIASGRFPASVWLHAREAGMNFPLVALNGAVTLDTTTGSLLSGFPLSAADAARLVSIVQACGAYVHFYGFNTLYVPELNEMNKRWPLANVVVHPDKELTEENYRLQTEMIRVEAVNGEMIDFVQNSEVPVYKAAVICTDTLVLDQLLLILQNWGTFELTRTGSHRFDVNASGVNKQSALVQLCSEHGIDSSEVAAAGDYDNDLAMLRWAGLGIAMGNAKTHVQAAAKVVTGSNSEDGLAQAIQRHLLFTL
ncbi:Cof-type HAD-IIB family hydrolase [Paenibacillus donghaensis]|uniref:Hydrolase n=1 Tax=Paenibacillus donghaensis TaxID=414771 RepID=A0A2Z2KEP4_9BACL|nr:Cof-type HAD-IIB family hydrolase [Paenibacillus donghaensis]ASA21573.1 hypothetical protein B9T62_12805 [Paenibacillus donghaensis]